MTKIALLSDIHGNTTALEAVIADALSEKAAEFWLIGDLIMPGPGASNLFNLLKQINLTLFVRGNWEDCYLEGLADDLDLTQPTNLYIARLAQYQHERLTPKDIQQINALPLQEFRQVNGISIGISHNLPHKNYGAALSPAGRQEDFDLLFNEDIDIAVYGHVHHPMMRYSSQDQLIINPGSIGQPFCQSPRLGTDLRAQYALLEIDEEGVTTCHFKKVAYDIERELREAKLQELPYYELYKELLETGKNHTHDAVRLNELNQKYGYSREVKDFLAKK